MPDYLVRLPNGAFKYQMAVPLELRAFFGFTNFTEYIKAMPRREALAEASNFSVRDRGRIKNARQSVSTSQRQAIESMGGLAAAERKITALTAGARLPKPKLLGVVRSVYEAGEAAYDSAVAQTAIAEVSWDKLFSEWQRIRHPLRTRKVQQTILQLKAYFGELDLTQLTATEIAKFRDHLIDTKTTTPKMVMEHLKHIKFMFAAVTKEPSSPFRRMPNNPATGVKVLEKLAPTKEALAFSPAQVAHIFRRAKETEFGNNLRMATNDDVILALRLMAHTGARPNEVLQLQAGDIQEVHGFPVIHIRDTDAETGLKNKFKSLKGDRQKRLIPIHPDIADVYDYASQFPKDHFLFHKFRWAGVDAKRLAWFSHNFPSFLKEVCDIQNPTLVDKYSLYSFRQSFANAIDTAGGILKLRNLLMGHHLPYNLKYGGRDLKLLQDVVHSLKITE